MFSLLITLIAIALVAALALATLYYGGPLFNQGAEAAHAARIDAQAQQILGAMELYNAEVGHYPAVLEDLVSSNYLKSIPVAQAAQAVSVAMASTTTWLMAASGNPVIVTQQVPMSTCMAYNKLNLGQNAVLATVHDTAMRQCYGTDPANLTIVVGKSGADIVNVAGNPASVVQLGTVLSTVVPSLADTTANGWSFVPGSSASAPTATLGFTDSTGAISAVAFGNVAVGSSSAAHSVTVTNNSTTTASITGAVASAPFAVSANTCTGSLAAGATCTVSVTFNPTIAQTYAAGAYALTLQSSNGTAGTLQLSGTGVVSGPSASDVFLENFSVAGKLNGRVPYLSVADAHWYENYSGDLGNVTNGTYVLNGADVAASDSQEIYTYTDSGLPLLAGAHSFEVKLLPAYSDWKVLDVQADTDTCHFVTNLYNNQIQYDLYCRNASWQWYDVSMGTLNFDPSLLNMSGSVLRFEFGTTMKVYLNGTLVPSTMDGALDSTMTDFTKLDFLVYGNNYDNMGMRAPGLDYVYMSKDTAYQLPANLQ